MSENIARLEKQFHRIAQLDHASTFLSWDQMVMMPDQGNTHRASALAELASLRHELLTAPFMGDCLSEAETEIDSGKLAPELMPHLREMRRTWEQAAVLPASLVHAQVLAGSRCEHGWREQRGNNDWQGFLANFTEVVDLSREEARCRQAGSSGDIATPYDAMLDLHCTGDSQALIGGVLGQLREQLPSLLERVMEKQATETVVDLAGHYPLDQQKRLSEELMRMLGFDFQAGRLDVSMHPFSTGGKGDQRITTRYRDNDFVDALQATAHETGHASYEAGLPAEMQSYPLGHSRNMCIHESQSLMFEKQIFLSRAFTGSLAGVVRQYLPSASFPNAEALWRAQTRVKPSFIRVEADEVTYPLHVMLRYDIESALINGDMEAADIPDAWEAAMQDYLGLSVDGNHAIGCLQDIHWTDGAFGYFPSYTLGAVNAAQLMASLKQQHPDWQTHLAKGDIDFIREWLSAHIWSRGCEVESQELMSAATGEGSNARHLIAHLESRYLQDSD